MVFAFAACTSNEKQDFDIKGVWRLECIHVIGGNDFNYDVREDMVPTKIYDDSAYFVAYQNAETDRFVFRPSYSGKYKLIDKGAGEYLYLEDKDIHQLTVVNDTLINVQDVGRVCEWHRISKNDNENAKDMLGVVEQIKDSWDEDENSYVFTEKERTLTTDKQNLTAVIICIALAFVLFAYYSYNTFQNKKRLEMQLKQTLQEIEERPKVVQEALTSVEDEFHSSEFYLSIRQRIADGERIRKADWKEIEHQLNSTYPGFTGRLLNLYAMSETELQTCLLIKLGVPMGDIANVLSKSASAISSTRSRLYNKVFHEKGGAKEWDDFIASL